MTDEEYTDVRNMTDISLAIHALQDCSFEEGTKNCADMKEIVASLQRMQQRLMLKMAEEQA